MAEVRPGAIALENVPGFEGSRVHGRLREALDRAGYRVRETLLCPSELGVPNRRRRYYLAALQGAALQSATPFARWNGARLPDLVDRGLNADPDGVLGGALRVDPDLVHRYEGTLHVVDPDDPDAVTACFTAAYGRSHVRSGSYLRLPSRTPEPRLRRFAPHEILRLLGFPKGYSLPPDLPPARAWPLVGNSLSLPPARAVLATVLG
jgi:site-specific DNA-cytosine methylase